MSAAFTLAQHLLELAGAGSFLLVIPDPDDLAIELRLLGCEVLAPTDLARRLPDNVVLCAGDELEATATMLTQLAGTAMRHVVLLPGENDPQLLWFLPRAAGLRRAAAQATRDDSRCLLLERHAMAGAFDPLFDAPALAPRLLAHAAFAATLVRPRDRVLVLADDAGASAALIAATSRCDSVAAHLDPACVAQAAANYGPRLEVRCAARSLDDVPPGAVDLLVALDATPPSVEEMLRVLRPDGRAVVRTGGAEAWSADALAARSDCLLEEMLAAPGDAWPHPPGEQDGDDAFLAVISRHPLRAPAQRYEHPEFACSRGNAPLLAFEDAYQAPWLYRPLVQMGERLRSEEALVRLALEVLETSPGNSADTGAALCVLAYQVLQRRRASHVDDILRLVEAYVGAAGHDNPHALRWRVSLSYVAALACLLAERREDAARHFESVLAFDAIAFSPLLCTKQVAAAFWLGVFALNAADVDGARACFLTGTRVASAALAQPIERAVGDPACPAAFGFAELAEVADMGAQCANAVQALHLHARAPGLFWSRVQARRFGLASWLQQLERENAALRMELQRRASHPDA